MDMTKFFVGVKWVIMTRPGPGTQEAKTNENSDGKNRKTWFVRSVKSISNQYEGKVKAKTASKVDIQGG